MVRTCIFNLNLYIDILEIDSDSGDSYTYKWTDDGDHPNKVLDILIEFGASTELLSLHNELPLHLALRFNDACSECEILFLLKQSKDVDIASDDGSYPLLMATKRGYFKVIRRLITLGADVNHQDREKNTVLHACMGKFSLSGCVPAPLRLRD